MSDNSTVEADMAVRIYQSNTDTASTATTDDTMVFSSYGVLTAGELVGPLDADKYVNYLVVVEDEGGNTASSAITVLSANTITITAIKRNEGPASGGKLITITGTGFSAGNDNGYGTDTTVTIGGFDCGSVVYQKSNVITCVTAGGSGTKNVVLQNPEGSSATEVGGYTYNPTSSHICDNSGSWGTYFADGVGTSGDPFIICNATHLDNIFQTVPEGSCTAIRNGNCYFKVQDNIDLTGESLTHTYFYGTFDGDGHSLINYTWSGSVRHGLFNNGGGVLKNFYYLNIDLTQSGSGASNGSTGSLIGQVYSGKLVTIDNVHVTGTINAVNYSAGFIGYATGASAGSEIKNTTFEGTITCSSNNCGGILGYYPAGGDNIWSFDNISSSGSVTGAGSIGGLFGDFGSISSVVNSHSTASITATSSYSGGLGGSFKGAVSNSYFTGTINGGGFSGGLFGQLNYGQVSNSYFTGTINNPWGYTGGIMAQAYYLDYLTNVYATGNLVGRDGIGGLIGRVALGGVAFDSTISNSYFDGNISANTTNNSYSGGLIGHFYWFNAVSPQCDFTISQSYSKGTMTTDNYRNQIGGIVGGYQSRGDHSCNLNIEDTYSAIDISNAGSDVGGLFGLIQPTASAAASNIGDTITVNRSFVADAVWASNTTKGGIGGRIVLDSDDTYVAAGNFFDTEATMLSNAFGAGTSPMFGNGVQALEFIPFLSGRRVRRQ
jgi:hypothetical protein